MTYSSEQNSNVTHKLLAKMICDETAKQKKVVHLLAVLGIRCDVIRMPASDRDSILQHDSHAVF